MTTRKPFLNPDGSLYPCCCPSDCQCRRRVNPPCGCIQHQPAPTAASCTRCHRGTSRMHGQPRRVMAWPDGSVMHEHCRHAAAVAAANAGVRS